MRERGAIRIDPSPQPPTYIQPPVAHSNPLRLLHPPTHPSTHPPTPTGLALFNHVAIGALRALERCERVAVVDLAALHGNGTEDIVRYVLLLLLFLLLFLPPFSLYKAKSKPILVLLTHPPTHPPDHSFQTTEPTRKRTACCTSPPTSPTPPSTLALAYKTTFLIISTTCPSSHFGQKEELLKRYVSFYPPTLLFFLSICPPIHTRDPQ